jgi:hypothetical protein
METGPANAKPEPGELVFITGVGAVPAKDYQEMYAAGEAMCSVVRKSCQVDWAGAQCQTAQIVFRLSEGAQTSVR